MDGSLSFLNTIIEGMRSIGMTMGALNWSWDMPRFAVGDWVIFPGGTISVLALITPTAILSLLAAIALIRIYHLLNPLG